MVVVAQLVRASVCGTEGRGFESRLPPIQSEFLYYGNSLFIFIMVLMLKKDVLMIVKLAINRVIVGKLCRSFK